MAVSSSKRLVPIAKFGNHVAGLSRTMLLQPDECSANLRPSSPVPYTVALPSQVQTPVTSYGVGARFREEEIVRRETGDESRISRVLYSSVTIDEVDVSTVASSQPC